MAPSVSGLHVYLLLQAQQALVKAFKRLRAEDATPGSSSAYRITVRQLEALIRLSEAMARVYCEETVSGKHVQEVRVQQALGLQLLELLP